MTPRELKSLAGPVFADLGRARVTPRQALLYERLVRVTLCVGRQAVRIPRLYVFEAFGVSKGNVSDALNGFALEGRRVPGLVELGMVQVTDSPDGGAVWTVLPDATQWRCAWRFDRTADAALLALLDAVADQIQPDLWPREPELAEALAEVSAENARSRIGNAPEVDRSRIGNAEMARKPEVCPPLKVPEFRSSKLLTPKLSKEETLLGECRALFGEKVMTNWGGAWRNRARQNAGKLVRVLAETRSEAKVRVLANPSGYANDLWKRWV